MPSVAISGSSSSGKSTLLKDLFDPLHRLTDPLGIEIVWHKERARIIYERDYAHLYPSFEEMLKHVPLEYQLRLAEAFADDAREMASNPQKLFVADRTGFDVAVYTAMLGGSGPEDARLINSIFGTLHPSLRAVDHVFLTSALSEMPESDGHRPDNYNDPATRALEVNMFKHIGVLFPHVTPLPRDREARVQTVCGVIAGMIAQEAAWQV